MSDPQPPQMPSLKKLLEAVGAGTYRQAQRISRELACQTFASAYVSTWSPEDAYRTLRNRPRTRGEGSHGSHGAHRWWMQKRSMQWLRQKRVQRLICEYVEKIKRRAQIEVRELADQISADMQVDIFDYVNESGTEFVLTKSALTPQQRRAVKSIQITPTKWGDSVKVTMVDRQRAQELAMALIALTRKLGELEEGGTLPGELIKHLEALQHKRIDLLERLPPSRIRHIIEGESKPV